MFSYTQLPNLVFFKNAKKYEEESLRLGRRLIKPSASAGLLHDSNDPARQELGLNDQ